VGVQTSETTQCWQAEALLQQVGQPLMQGEGRDESHLFC